MLKKASLKVVRFLIILLSVFLLILSVIIFLTLPRAIDIAKNFSKDYAKGLRFVKPYTTRENKIWHVKGYYLQFANADMAVNLKRREVEGARLKVRGLDSKNLDPNDLKAWEKAREIAVQFVKTLYKDFEKKNMICDRGENCCCRYIFRCNERVKVGKYYVRVDDNELSITVDCLNNFVYWYAPAFRVQVSPSMFKPIVIDKSRALSIGIEFLKSKVKFPMKHTGVSGPFFGKSSKKDNNAPRKVFWYVSVYSGEIVVEGVMVGNGNVRVDAVTGKILDYEYDEWPHKKPKWKAVRKVKVH